jgi:hypothetical protein
MFRISLDPSSGSNKKQYLTNITYNFSTVKVMRCQCLAAYLTCTVCVYCTGWRYTGRSTTVKCEGYALSVLGCIFNLYCVCLLHRLVVYWAQHNCEM